MTIGQIAKAAGVPQSAIRYYEAAGILPPPPRKNGVRCYDADSIDELKIVRFYRRSGVTIRSLTAIASEHDASRWNIRLATVQRQIAQLEASIAEAQKAKSRLEQLVVCQCNGVRRDCVIFS